MASVSDNFNRANESPIAAPWSSMFGAVQLSSQAITRTGASTDNAVRYSGAGLANDQFAQLTFVTVGNTAQAAGPTIRCSSTAATYYVARGSTGGHSLSKVIAGAFTGLAGGGAACVATDTLYVESSGSNLVVKRNGSTTIGASDGAITSGDPGAHFAAGVAVLDDFSAGDFATGQGLLFSHLRNYSILSAA